MAKIIAVTNQKGGVGKTTITCNLAFAAKERGAAVAVVDLDSQGHAGVVISRDPRMCKKEAGGAQILFEEETPEFSSTDRGIDLLHGHEWLSNVDFIDDVLGLAVQIKERVRALPYDYVIIDTPASGARQFAALLWANLAVVPVEPAFLSMGGLSDIQQNMARVRPVNPGLVARVVINRYLAVSKRQQANLAEVERHFPGLVIGNFRTRVAVEETLACGQAVWEYTKDKALGAEWRGFCDRVLDTIK